LIDQVINACLAVFLGIGFCFFYFAGTNWLLDRILADRRSVDGTSNTNARRRSAIRPWLFAGPSLLILSLYLVYPVYETLKLSLMDNGSVNFVGFSNYIWLVSDPEFVESVGNNLLWLIIVPAMSCVMGLLVATLADRVWWGNIAKSLIFMPMAISFVGASVIWKFVYDFGGPEGIQIGILNAMVSALGGEPKAWITIPFWNNIFLMIILVWIQTGFAMVIFSAALRGVPEDTLEAARMDGANEIQIFLRIMVPQIITTILVVWTTITIIVLKVFDIVLAMTNGQWDTEVLANMMFDWMFRGGGDFGRGSAIAVVIMFAVIPIMVWNIKRFKQEEGSR
jgi:alpha-glucoside transport system permease protein